MKPFVQAEIEKLSDVTRTWFEWVIEGGRYTTTLMVEVDFDTSPNAPGFKNVFEDYFSSIRKIIDNSTMVVHRINIIPKNR